MRYNRVSTSMPLIMEESILKLEIGMIVLVFLSGYGGNF